MLELVDSHAHLDFSAFDDDREEVIRQAEQAGVKWIINIGAGEELKSAHRSLELARRYQNIFSTVGIHPHDAKIWSPQVRDEIVELAQKPKVVAIGEIGLDFAKEYSPREVQEKVFYEQLELARELGLPVVIHSRDAHDKTFKILKEMKIKQAVMHCYSGSLELAKQLVKMGFYLSIPGVVTFKNAKKLLEVVREISLEHLLIETDCPFLAPEPYRGKRNQPAYVKYVAEKIAELKNTSLEEVASKTTENVLKLFSLKG